MQCYAMTPELTYEETVSRDALYSCLYITGVSTHTWNIAG